MDFMNLSSFCTNICLTFKSSNRCSSRHGNFRVEKIIDFFIVDLVSVNCMHIISSCNAQEYTEANFLLFIDLAI